MKNELDKQLCAKYPLIFKDRNASMQETLMCFGFECGDGWYNILDALCSNIQWHINHQLKAAKTNAKYNKMRELTKSGDWTLFEEHYCEYNKQYVDTIRAEIVDSEPRVVEEVEQVVAVQVKEKFGTLRFYYDGGDDVISGMVAVAESMSGVTCEVCGSPGTPGGVGWIRTLCKSHSK